jgi:hypothetical protein
VEPDASSGEEDVGEGHEGEAAAIAVAKRRLPLTHNTSSAERGIGAAISTLPEEDPRKARRPEEDPHKARRPEQHVLRARLAGRRRTRARESCPRLAHRPEEEASSRI